MSMIAAEGLGCRPPRSRSAMTRAAIVSHSRVTKTSSRMIEFTGIGPRANAAFFAARSLLEVSFLKFTELDKSCTMRACSAVKSSFRRGSSHLLCQNRRAQRGTELIIVKRITEYDILFFKGAGNHRRPPDARANWDDDAKAGDADRDINGRHIHIFRKSDRAGLAGAAFNDGSTVRDRKSTRLNS